MKYRLIPAKGDLINIYLKNNALNKADFLLNDFTVDHNQEALLAFKDKLLENRDKKFLIVGDYDCDGICGTVITKRLLEKLDIAHNFYIPSRVRDGYGLNESIVDKAYANSFDVLLLVDNGIVADEAIIKAKEKGMKVFIIDHHEFEKQDHCDIYLHPTILKEGYKNLCGAALAYLLYSSFFDSDDTLLSYAALATLADMVDVEAYNRYLCTEMMNIIKTKDIYQLELLNGKKINSYDDLSFNVIPKINAFSRLDGLANVNFLVRYLLENRSFCQSKINGITYINDLRRKYSRDMTNKAVSLINENDKVIVVSDESFKEGICGLCANRLMNIYNKCVIVLSHNEGIYKGSGRCPLGFDIYRLLSPIKDNLLTFGGHEQAVGLSFNEEYYDDFIKYLQSLNIVYEEYQQDVYEIDLDDINGNLLKELAFFQPYSEKVKEPLIALKNNNYQRTILKEKYTRFNLSNRVSAITFDEKYKNREFTYLIGYLRPDTYRSNNISIMIEDLI